MTSELHLNDPRDTLKMIRETLCVAQSAVGNEHRERIQRMIREIDRQRPLGLDGTHGDRHTPTCGCEPSEWEASDRRKALHSAALTAFYRARLSGPINPDARIKEVLDTVAPLIAADALREAARAAEHVTMVYDQDSDDGWRNWMCERAEVLERSRTCARCGALVHRVPCPTGDWWAHVDHPADNHDAEVRDEA